MASLAEWLKTLTPEQNQFVARLVASLPESEGGLGLPLKNTAFERMQAMRQPGISDLYHGGAEEITALNPARYGSSTGAKSAKQAFWTVSDPSTAVSYSHYAATHAPVKRLMDEAQKYADAGDWDAYDAALSKAEELEKQFYENNLAGQNVMPLVALKGKNEAIDIGGQHFVDEEQKINKHLLQSKAKRADFATFENLSDDPFFDSKAAQHVAVLNPSKIRSKYAAFNPWRTNESNLLASHPVATALGSATLAKMLGAGQNIDLRQSINDKLSKSADPLGLYSRYGMEAPYSYGDVAQQAIGATDLYAPIAAGEAIEAAKKGEWKKSGLSALGALPIIGAIKASHGSPHAFEKFNFSKIGTGEGAQAYGHGGYFAQGFDSPVAKQYKEALSGGAKKAVNASFAEDPELWAAGQLHSGIKPEDIADGLSILGYKGNPSELIKSAKNRLKNELDAGHMYNVELRWPDPAREAADPLGMEHFLDWYQPFSQQPDNVKDAVIKALHNDAYKASQSEPRAFNPESEPSWMADLFSGDTPKFNPSDYYDLYRSRTGEQIYKTLAERLGGAKEASALLRESGLPGLRYQDEKSRYLPYSQGTHNFVMFDDALANIVSRNGVSLSDLLKTSESPQNKLDAIIQNLESQGLKIDASYNPNKQQISLSRLVVPQEMRSQGVGTKAMQDLVNFADEQNALMQLSPSTDFGATSINRLKDFYKRFGFVPNTGKYKDYSISESMYRPKK